MHSHCTAAPEWDPGDMAAVLKNRQSKTGLIIMVKIIHEMGVKINDV